jgi:hypothetical protein
MSIISLLLNLRNAKLRNQMAEHNKSNGDDGELEKRRRKNQQRIERAMRMIQQGSETGGDPFDTEDLFKQ